jgi:hypothetical protein
MGQGTLAFTTSCCSGSSPATPSDSAQGPLSMRVQTYIHILNQKRNNTPYKEINEAHAYDHEKTSVSGTTHDDA